jgi:hypothetical protein
VCLERMPRSLRCVPVAVPVQMQKPCEPGPNDSQGFPRIPQNYAKNAKAPWPCEGLGGSRSIHLSYGDEVCILRPMNHSPASSTT